MVAHEQMETEPHEDAPINLWAAALSSLSEADRKDLAFARGTRQLGHADVLEVVEAKRNECEKVLLREVLGRVADWLDRFKQALDCAVQFDPGQAAIPWAVVRTILQMTVNDCQTFGGMVESLDSIAGIIARYTELETKVLIRTSNLSAQLASALVRLYEAALRFLLHAWRYYSQSTLKRALKSTVTTAKMMIDEPMLRIEKHEAEVYKLVCLVQNEISGAKLDDIISAIRTRVESVLITSEERRRKLTAWISGTDTQNTYYTALQYHHSGTCEWVLQLSEFQRWEAPEGDDPSLLWLHGPAGFGKTFMAARIIQHLEEQKEHPLAYFFCVADNQLTRDPYAVLRSWLTQLAERDDAAALAMDTIYRAGNQEQSLTHLGLWDLFVVAGKASRGCTFVLDGFDECTDIDTGARYHRNDPRGNFLRDLRLRLPQTGVKVLIISRDVPDIREHLAGDAPDGMCVLTYGITAKDTAADVRSFSEHVINTRLARKKADLRLEIAAQAAERSEGMFLWIKLLEQEISPGQNAKQLKRTITEMPSGISEAYSRELDRTASLPPDEKEAAVTILRWVLFAVRPLQVKQLAEALVVSGDDLDAYPADELPDCWDETFVDDDYVREMILGRCGSLLQLRSARSDTPLADHTVHFVHFSVKEYLTSLGAEVLGLGAAAAEERYLSGVCLRYLTLDTFEEVPEDTAVYPFLSYAAWAWYYHSYHEKPAPGEDIMRRTQRAFDPAISSWRVWTPVLEKEYRDSKEEGEEKDDEGEEEGRDDDDNEDEESDREDGSRKENDDKGEEEEDDDAETDATPSFVLTPIYYASLLGLTDVVRWLEDQGLDCGCEGGRLGFPLQAAVVGGHEAVVKHLIARGVNVSQYGGQYGTALVAAAAEATTEIVGLLLAAGADVSRKGPSGSTALHWAAYRGNVEAARLLLDHGADIEAGGVESPRAVYFACGQGHREVVALLAERGADLETSDEHASVTPLGIAVTHGMKDVVEVLLSRGVSPNGLGPSGIAPIHLARPNPHLLSLLASAGADLEIQDDEGFTPMQCAAGYGDVAYIAALLDAGADIRSAACVDKATPLQAALINKQLEAAEYLLKRGADLNDKSGGTATALMLALTSEDDGQAKWLLSKGASLAGLDEDTQQSLFDMAVSRPESGIARLLARHGCFGGGVPVEEEGLLMGAFDGDVEAVGQWLSSNKGSITRELLAEALAAAAAQGHLDVVKLLLGYRAPVNMKDINGRTSLHHADL
ncbi:ankyrin repeat and SOCS box protein 7 [Plectosphaerella cucumerina]|uniref:Ankyrin repeat and SOCS box protein 7 n=1 Tax=Plectosphaerella cucumerina TaxID=40658 RepID=A0A8K0TE67_9PEZI|nr:ankyrin repeat and SOCS box protein 7 [Plectosphaerella cucumerina]